MSIEFEHNILIKLLLKDLNELLNIQLTLRGIQEESSFLFHNEFDVNIYAPIKTETQSGIIMIQLNSLTLNHIYSSITGMMYHSDSELEDFGKEIINTLGARFIEILNISSINLGIPQKISVSDIQSLCGQSQFTIYTFLFNYKLLNIYFYFK